MTTTERKTLPPVHREINFAAIAFVGVIFAGMMIGYLFGYQRGVSVGMGMHGEQVEEVSKTLFDERGKRWNAEKALREEREKNASAASGSATH